MGKRIYTAGGSFEAKDFAIKAWDIDTGREVGRLEGHKDYVWRLAVSPDGRYLLFWRT